MHAKVTLFNIIQLMIVIVMMVMVILMVSVIRMRIIVGVSLMCSQLIPTNTGHHEISGGSHESGSKCYDALTEHSNIISKRSIMRTYLDSSISLSNTIRKSHHNKDDSEVFRGTHF